MKGNPAKMGMIQGTAGYSSALKMKMEKDAAAKMKKEAAMKMKKEAAMKMKSPMEKELVGNQNNLPEELKAKIEASPAKQMYSPEELAKNKDAKETMDSNLKDSKAKTTTKKSSGKKADPYAKAAKKDPKLGEYVKQRKGLKKGTPEYAKVQNKINAAYGVNKRYDEGPAATTSDSNVKQTKLEKKTSKMDKKYDKQANRRVVKDNETTENRKVQDARRTSKYAKAYFGKGSAEHVAEKANIAKAKGEDLAGEGGGRKAKLFGNLRRKLNKKRQEKLNKKADRLANEKQAKEDKMIAEYNEKKNKS